MTRWFLGGLQADPVAGRPDLVAAPVLAALTALDLLEDAGVVAIDPAVSDTAALAEAYGLAARVLVNCVLIGGSRAGEERVAACLVPSSKRADVNGFVRRRLDVRTASFLPRERAVGASGMEFGAITPVGLPPAWAVLVDPDAVREPLVVIGSGLRRSKLVVPGTLLARLRGAELAPELARHAA